MILTAAQRVLYTARNRSTHSLRLVCRSRPSLSSAPLFSSSSVTSRPISRRAMSSTSSSDVDEWKHLVELIDKAKFAMMATVQTSDSTIRSRPMATQHVKQEEKGILWFFTGEHSAKVEELKSNPEINLGYIGDGQSLFISVSGKGELCLDKAKMKELYSPALKAWFPKGLDDPEMALIKVTVTQAEYWNNNSPKVVQVSLYHPPAGLRPLPGPPLTSSPLPVLCRL